MSDIDNSTLYFPPGDYYLDGFCYILDKHARSYAVDAGTMGLLPRALSDPVTRAPIGEGAHLLTCANRLQPTWSQGICRLGYVTMHPRNAKEGDFS